MDFFDYIKNNRLIILIISLTLNVLIGLFSITLIFKKNSHENNSHVVELAINDNEEVKDVKNNFKVEIKGAVSKPGVYLVNDEDVIDDLIKLAGGLKKNGYTNNINLSKRLTPELVVYIYTESEYKKLVNKSNFQVKEIFISEPCECKNYDISNCTTNAQSEIITSDKDTVFNDTNNQKIKGANSKVNINTASKEELLTLSGIGEGKAISIIEYRNKNGSYKSIDEIINVSGIGNALFEKIKDNITV